MTSQIFRQKNSVITANVFGESIEFCLQISHTGRPKQKYLGQLEINQNSKNGFSRFQASQSFRIRMLDNKVLVELNENTKQITFFQPRDDCNKVQIGSIVLQEEKIYSGQHKIQKIIPNCQKDMRELITALLQINIKQRKQINDLKTEITRLKLSLQRQKINNVNLFQIQRQQRINEQKEFIENIPQCISDFRVDFQKFRRRCIRSDENQSNLADKAQDWVDKNCAYNNDFLYNANEITSKIDKIMIFGSDQIHKGNPGYSIIIGKMKLTMKVGIADSKFRNKIKFTDVSNIAYCQSNGDSKVGSTVNCTEKGDDIWKFKQDNKIRISVDFQAKQFKYTVNGLKWKRIKYRQLENKNIQWVPFIYFNDKGDSVSLPVS